MGRSLDSKTLNLVEAIRGIVSPEKPSTLRFVYYKLISLGLIENSDKSYNGLVNKVRDARIRGDLDDNCFHDLKRVTDKPAVWTDLEDYREWIQDVYRRDRWRTQPRHLEILVEKGTVGEVVRPVTRKWGVTLRTSTGTFGRCLLCETASDIADAYRLTTIGYIGDHDPSGLSIEAAARSGNGKNGTLRREGLLDILIQKHGFDDVEWHRLAVTENDLKNVPQEALVPAKKTDKSFSKYTQKYGDYGCEVEALDQTVLQERVESFITGHIDFDLWNAEGQKEQEDIEALAEIG